MTLYRFTACIAPKEYTFKDPDTKFPFTGTSIPDLASKVRIYRLQNELEDLPYLETIIESYLCKLPSNLGGCEKLPPLKRGLMETFRGGIAVIKSMLYNAFASQEAADERAEICIKCPLNKFYDRGPFVKWCDDIAEDVVGTRRSKYHNELGICEGCNCGLRFKVFYNDKISLNKRQRKIMGEAEPNCWQLREEKNG